MVVYGICVASRSIMFEKSCLLSHIEALYINSPVPPYDYRRKCTATIPLLTYDSYYKIYTRRGMINAYLQILLLDFSP